MNPEGKQRRAGVIDLLPRTTDQAVAEAIDEALVTGNRTQLQALDALNAKLAAMKVEPVSKSAWNRLLMRLDEEGVPRRWRLGGGEMVPADTFLKELTALIDARIALALKRRRPRT